MYNIKLQVKRYNDIEEVYLLVYDCFDDKSYVGSIIIDKNGRVSIKSNENYCPGTNRLNQAHFIQVFEKSFIEFNKN